MIGEIRVMTMLMPPLPSGYFFLDDLNSPSDVGIPATYSDSGSSWQSSLSSLPNYASATSDDTGSCTLPTQRMAQIVQPTSMADHVGTSGLVPCANYHTSSSGILFVSVLNPQVNVLVC